MELLARKFAAEQGANSLLKMLCDATQHKSYYYVYYRAAIQLVMPQDNICCLLLFMFVFCHQMIIFSFIFSSNRF